MRFLKHPLVLLTLLSSLMFGLFLDVEPLYDWDEAWYGQIAKELLRSNDWMTLTYRGTPFFDKPPLAIWAIAMSFKLFGQAEWAARLPSALAAILTIGVVYWIGMRVFKRRRPALLSALVLLTTLPYVKAARFAMLDAPLTLAFSLGVAFYLAAKEDRRWGIGLGASFALVWFLKGPLALLLFVDLGIFSLMERDWKVWKSPWWAVGLLAGLLLVLPWYLIEWQRHGMAFLRSHFGVHILGRASAAMEGHEAPFTFYLGQLAAIDHPWFVAILAALILAWRRREETAVQLALCWIGVVLGAFSLAATKLPWYVMPAYPGLALLLGWFLDDLLQRETQAKILGRTWLGLGSVLLVGGTVYLLAFAQPMDRPYWPAAVLLSAGMLFAGQRIQSNAPRQGLSVLFASCYLAFIALMPWTLHWETRFSPSFKPLSQQAKLHLQGISEIYTLTGPVRPSFIYYLDRPEHIVSPEELIKSWAAPSAALLTQEQWRDLAPRLDHAEVMASSSLVLVSRSR